MRRRKALLLSIAVVAVVLLLVLAASGSEALMMISGVIAIVSLGLMLFTDVMFGKHERSEEWDEFLHQPPQPPRDEPSRR